MLDSDDFTLIGLGIVLTVLVAILLIGLIRNDVKNGKHKYNTYIVVGDPARAASISTKGDGRLVATPAVGVEFTIIIVGDSLNK